MDSTLDDSLRSLPSSSANPAASFEDNSVVTQTAPNLDSDDAELNLLFLKAAKNGTLKIMVDYIRRGAQPDAITRSHGYTALILAAQHNHLAIVKYFLSDENPDTNIGKTLLNKTDTLGYTALMWAAQQGHEEIAQFLILATHQGDIDVTNNQDETALLLASKYGHASIVAFLILAGADTESRPLNGRVPLMAAAMHGRREVIVTLLGAKADPRKTRKGKTALDYATQHGRVEIIPILQIALKIALRFPDNIESNSNNLSGQMAQLSLESSPCSHRGEEVEEKEPRLDLSSPSGSLIEESIKSFSPLSKRRSASPGSGNQPESQFSTDSSGKHSRLNSLSPSRAAITITPPRPNSPSLLPNPHPRPPSRASSEKDLYRPTLSTRGRGSHPSRGSCDLDQMQRNTPRGSYDEEERMPKSSSFLSKFRK